MVNKNEFEIMKKYIYILCSIALISCNSKYVLIDSFQGNVYSKKTDTPIKGVLVFTDSLSINFFTPIKTNEDGFFVTNSMITKDYDTYFKTRKNISYKLVFQAQGYINDTIDLKSHNKNNRVIDTIILGKIFLNPNIKKE